MNPESLLVTGKSFTGMGFRSLHGLTRDLLSTAEDEVQVMAYLITGSAGRLLDSLEDALQRGVKCTFVINGIHEQSLGIRGRLLDLEGRFDNFILYDFKELGEGNLHAKVLVVDRQKAIIGSANLSWGGMLGNHEVGVLVEGEAAWDAGRLVDEITWQLISRAIS